MKNRISSKAGRVLKGCLPLCLFALLPLSAQAQQAGDIISGQVTDAFGPVMMANVIEVDASNRIIAAATTDMNGNFSFKLKNPKDKLKVSYVGYKTQVLPINKTHFVIKMQDQTTIKEVTVTAKKKAQGSGLNVPVKEISTSRQTISTKEFEGLPVTSIDEALQGRIAGLDIVANSGNLGSGSSMRLRGVSSINGSSEPLIVVDGNVWETGSVNDFDFSSANDEKFAELLNVNPEDIESISVLKDAAATAIWGSQGANGVIEIKTKRGARGNTKVTYSYRITGTYQPKGMNLLNGDEYTMMLKEEYYNPKMQAGASANIDEINYRLPPEFAEGHMYNENTDWVKAVTKTGWLHKHYVSLSGGGEKANFRIAAGYDHQTGTVIEQKLDRFTTRVALDYFVSDRIKIATNVALTYTDNKRNAGSLLSIAYRRMPNLAIYAQDNNGNSLGTYYNMLPTVNQVFRDNQLKDKNPVALAYLAKDEETSYNIEPEFKLNYELLGVDDEKSRLSYEGKVVFNIFNRYNDMFMPLELNTKGWQDGDANKGTNNAYKSLGITTTHTLTFVPHFRNTDHSLMMMLRGQLTNGNSTAQNSSVSGLPSGTIISSSAPGLIADFGSSPGRWRSIYLTYSAHYAFKGRYVVDFSVRRDGSTKFGPDQRWGNFPALSGKWVISDEPWFQKILPFVSMFAVRPGWGIVGAQPGGEGLFYSKYSAGTGYMTMGSTIPNNIRLKNLKWEQKETFNVGIDFGFWNDRINGNVEFYRQKTTDLIMNNRALPSSSGYATLSAQNVGAMENVGWEFNLNGNRIIRAGKFSADFNITFANNRNKLTEMDETVLASLNSDFNHRNGSYLSRVELNKPLGGIYGFRYLGVYQYSKYSDEEVPGVSGPNAPVVRDADGNVVRDNYGRTKEMYFNFTGQKNEDNVFHGGDAIYDDVNHDGQINELDIVYLGSSLPKFTGGFGFKLNYGRLSLNNQFNFRYGNKVINAARMNAENMYSNNNQSRAVNWRWRVEGDDRPIPRALYNYGYNWLGSDRFVEDGSFIRLNYTQLSYAFSQKTLKKLGLSQLNVYVSANNLFCITKYSGADPEVGYGGYGVVTDNGQTPRARSFTGGVTVSF